jgi:glucokinase
VPRIVDFETGAVVSTSRPAAPGGNGAVELPLADVALRQVLQERIGVPVFVDNVANVAALAEAHDEELELVARHLVMLTVGAGVGGGLVLGGRIHRGATGAAGELGHTIVGLDLAGAVPTPMGFPQPGSLDFVASGHALDRLATVAGRVHPESALARFRTEGKPVLGPAVIEAALDGDKSAARMVEVWGQRIGIGVANAIHTFDPEEVVIGGDAIRAGALLLEPARRVALEYLLPGLGAHTTIRLARHGANVGLIGAALLARCELEPAA